MVEDLFLVYFNHLLHLPAHLSFDETGLNPIHLYSKAIVVDQDCLLFLTPKNLSEVFFPHLFRSKVLPSKIFPCWEYIHWDNFCIFDLDLFQSSSTVKSSSSSVQVNLLNLTVCPLLVFVKIGRAHV